MWLRVFLLLFTLNVFAQPNQLNSSFLPIDKVTNKSNGSELYQLLINNGYQKLTLQKIHGALYVKGKVNNNPVLFLLDSGSYDASILSESLKKLNLSSKQSTRKVANSIGGIKNTKLVRLHTISIGSTKIKNIDAGIMEQPFKNKLPTIILGNKFFEKYNAIMDIGHNLLFIRQKTLSRQNQHQLQRILISQNFQVVPLTKLPSHHLILPIQINQAFPSYFLFDTGFSKTTLSIAYTKYLKITQDKYTRESATDGAITYSEIKLNKIILNPLQTFFNEAIQIENTKAASANIETLSNILSVTGVIGLSDMEKVKTIIDFSTNTAYLSHE
jgi:predicted aspartyl protease